MSDQYFRARASVSAGSGGIVGRRIIAYFVDVVVLALIGMAAWIAVALLGLVSFGLLSHPLWPLLGMIPFAYNILSIGSSHAATPGMRFCGIALRSLDGSRPGYFRAIIHTAVFYLTVPTTGWLILLVALVTPGNRTLHDIAAGVAMTEEP